MRLVRDGFEGLGRAWGYLLGEKQPVGHKIPEVPVCILVDAFIFSLQKIAQISKYVVKSIPNGVTKYISYCIYQVGPSQ